LSMFNIEYLIAPSSENAQHQLLNLMFNVDHLSIINKQL